MAESKYDTVVRLEAAFADWSARIVEANLWFAQEVTGAQEALFDAAADDTAVDPTVNALAKVRAHIEALSKLSGGGDGTGQRIAGLNQEAAKLYAELQALRRKVAPKTVMAGAPASQFEALQSELQRERERTALIEIELADQKELTDLLAHARKERDDALAQLAKLRAEIAAAPAVDHGAKASLVPFTAFDSGGHKRRMGEILVDAHVITRDQLNQALAEQKKNPQRRLGLIFVEMGFTGEDIVSQVLASQLQLEFVHLAKEMIDITAVRLISSQMATLHMLIPLRVAPGKLTVAMANPLDLIALDDVELATSRRVEPVVATAADISAAIVRFYAAS
ncbi:MAG: type pilus assembly protein PilB [Candidatus Hydrogenedentes bacterium]|nr:type pilus assembly protein PilB [Candidatus Hydrogenedentota bacterium]